MASANAVLQHRRRISKSSPTTSQESVNETTSLLFGPIGKCECYKHTYIIFLVLVSDDEGEASLLLFTSTMRPNGNYLRYRFVFLNI